jgi:hypothetical protein
MSKTTRKKVKIVGRENYINQNTGEIKEMQIINIEERDANFHKIWLGHILSSIDLIGNAKTKLAFWILDNMDSQNQLIGTHRKIAEKVGMSTKTVTETLKILIDADFLQKIQNGVYRINPNILWKGGKHDRMNVLIEYKNNSDKE